MTFSTYEIRPVDIPGIKGVFVRALSALPLAEVVDRISGIDKKPLTEQTKVMAFVCSVSCCDAGGAPLFETPDKALEESLPFLNACTEAAVAVNGLGEDHAKNS